METLISKSHKYQRYGNKDARYGAVKLAQIVGERQELGTKEDWNIFARTSVQKIRTDELKGREVLKMPQRKKNGNGKQ